MSLATNYARPSTQKMKEEKIEESLSYLSEAPFQRASSYLEAERARLPVELADEDDKKCKNESLSQI